MRKTVEFKDLKDGEFFECYGDVHLNYNSRKLCKCIKIDRLTGKEVNGIIFNIREIDTVFRISNDPKENNIVRIEDFQGLEILVNEHGFITKQKLNQLILEWSELKYYANFTDWCKHQL